MMGQEMMMDKAGLFFFLFGLFQQHKATIRSSAPRSSSAHGNGHIPVMMDRFFFWVVVVVGLYMLDIAGKRQGGREMMPASQKNK